MTDYSARGAPLTIERLGQRGEGVARGPRGAVYTPYALPGDEILAEIDGERGRLLEVVKPGPDRIPPICPHYGVCGGCAVQALEWPPYAAWKRDIVVSALHHVGLSPVVGETVDAHGVGRRRVTFHSRVVRDALSRPRLDVGFMRARSHDIVAIDVCPILDPGLALALPAAQALARVLIDMDKPLDIVVTATQAGLDVDMRGSGPIPDPLRQKLIRTAETLDLARVANHGEVLVERRPPVIEMGRARVTPSAGAFLQATVAGEEILARLVCARIGKARRVADLFSGIGTFAYRMSETAQVHAVESDAAALQAIVRASGDAGTALKPITTLHRDLFRRPLAAADLTPYDAVVFDPPRAGAEAQARELASSAVPLVVAVSCNPQTFARDARILVDGGYEMGEVTPVDQFRHSPHVEVVAAFVRPRPKGRKGRLLG